MQLVCLYPTRDLSDALSKCEENVYLHYITLHYFTHSIYTTWKVTLGHFLLHLSWNVSCQGPAILMQPSWNCTHGTAFRWWKCPDEFALHVHRSMPRDFLGRSLSESLRNTPWRHGTPHSCLGLYEISHYITTVSCLITSPPPPKKKKISDFFHYFHAAFST